MDHGYGLGLGSRVVNPIPMKLGAMPNFSLHAMDSPIKLKRKHLKTENSLTISELPLEVNFDFIFNIFCLYGVIEEIWVNYKAGVGLIRYDKRENMKSAVKRLNGLPIKGSLISLKRASKD